MKQIFKQLAVGALFLLTANGAQAQWIVTDPGNLAQNIKSVIEGSKTASNMIKNLEESKKIYDQGKAYYDALKSVSNLVKDARKVKETVEMLSEITDMYVQGFNRMLGDENFTPAELLAISDGYAKLLQEGGAMVSDLKQAVSGGNGLSLSDKDRMDIIDKLHSEMLSYRNLTRYYTQKNISVSYLRAKKKGDTERILSLYGSPSERYW